MPSANWKYLQMVGNCVQAQLAERECTPKYIAQINMEDEMCGHSFERDVVRLRIMWQDRSVIVSMAVEEKAIPSIKLCGAIMEEVFCDGPSRYQIEVFGARVTDKNAYTQPLPGGHIEEIPYWMLVASMEHNKVVTRG